MIASIIALSAVLPAMVAELPQAPPERAYSAFHEDPARRFDFWIGRWHVDLRKRDKGTTWEPLVQSTARIYSILDGKALLELWDSKPIVGYSLRYYDPDAGAWQLWLDWPGPDASRVSNLQGNFRHGRGVFEGRRPLEDGEERIARFSFDDITPFSLCWEDAFSTDSGETWRYNWIMEFSREALEPDWPIPHQNTPTLHDGKRCPADPYRAYEPLDGIWTGSDDEGRRWKLEAWRIIGGCAVMALLEGGGDERFLFITWNLPAERYELHVLDDIPGTPLRVLTGEDGVAFSDAIGHWSLQVYDEGLEVTTRPLDAAPRTIQLQRIPSNRAGN